MKQVKRMSREELLALKGEIEARLREIEGQEAQATQEGEARLEASQGGPEGQARARGSIEWKVIKGHTYAYLRFWDKGHLRSKYLGKNPLARLR